MAPPPGTLRVGRYFAALILLLGLLYLVVGFPGNRHTPKLGIDLVGGKRVIFTARTGNGTTPTSSSMSQARQIIEDRINGTGVTGATVQVQGDNQLVVLIPGGTKTDVAALGQPAVLNFRGVVAPAQVVTCVSNTSKSGSSAGASATPSSVSSPTAAKASSASANGFRERPLATAPTPTATGTSTPKAAATTPKAAATTPKAVATTPAVAATPSAAASSSAPATPCVSDPIGALVKADPGLASVLPNAEKCPSPSQTGTCHAYSTLSAARQEALAAALRNFDCSAAVTEPDEANRYYIACGPSAYGPAAYLLGHVVVKGSQIDSASAQAPSTGSGGSNTEWTVSLNLKSSGGDRWSKWTSAYHTSSTTAQVVQTTSAAPCGTTVETPCSDFVAFTLNGKVVSSPITQAVLDLQTQVSGSFNQKSANQLATQLNYGSLPLSFRTDANQDVSATLGTQQLHAALLAGGIGLALVVLYSLLYYRGLGVVTIASLLVSAGLTYAMLVILGTQIGFTLDLAGIAGFIVALGITADSFVVFFERIKDEVHEGRSIRVAVPRAWVRARRTILSADTVSFLAAAILYYFAAADVKGFAFTLGMSTILDLVVVFLFTHPIVSLLSRSRTFGSPRFTGLNSVRTSPVLDDELPTRRSRKPARGGSARPVEPDEPTETATERAQRRRGIAVLDKPDTDEPDPDEQVEDDIQVQDDAQVEDVSPVEDDTTVEAVSPVEDEPPATRRRTTPQSGSAAERAAARRARQREQREKGES